MDGWDNFRCGFVICHRELVRGTVRLFNEYIFVYFGVYFITVPIFPTRLSELSSCNFLSGAFLKVFDMYNQSSAFWCNWKHGNWVSRISSDSCSYLLHIKTQYIKINNPKKWISPYIFVDGTNLFFIFLQFFFT